MTDKHVCVIGAGVIGVTTAWQLAHHGWRVTLLDAASEPAAEASHANGGQLSYSYVAPLAEPGVWAHLPQWLLDPTSPLRFRPRLDPVQWRWCMRFLAACRPSTAASTTVQMLQLSFLSRAVLHEWMGEAPVEFGHLTNGKLIVYRTPALLDKARKQVRRHAEWGVEQKILSVAECTALEPALDPVAGRMAGAIHTPSEESGDCQRLTQGLFERLVTLPTVTARFGAKVGQFERRGRVICAAALYDGGQVEADHFVLAAGMGSTPLLKSLGGRSPLYPLKGYSLSLAGAGAVAPRISVTDYERRTVYANLNGTLRIAAMVGVGLSDTGVEPDRIALMRRQAQELLPQLNLDDATTWAGLRPATPDGRPRIGRSATADNLWLNIGHGALGFTLAAGSARLVQALMSAERVAVDATAFAPKHC